MGYKVKEEWYADRIPPYVKGKTKHWVIGIEDISIPNPPHKDIIREFIPESKIEEEFISIGIIGFFEKKTVQRSKSQKEKDAEAEQKRLAEQAASEANDPGEKTNEGDVSN